LAVNNFNAVFSALSGDGRLHAENNSVVTLTDYGAFTGTASGQGVVALQAADGADAYIMPKGINTVICNDGALPMSVVVTNTGAETFIGSLQDGVSALGLTQTGTGNTYYTGIDSTYTGATRIEDGTATVVSGVLTKFVRFKPSVTRPEGAHVNTGYQLSEFRLTLGGVDVPYPVGTLATSPGKTAGVEGPEKAIDGSVETKFYHNSKSPLYPLVLEFPTPVFFNGYAWYTANDATGRDAITWTVEISADGTTWTVVDSQDYSADTSLITTTRYTLAGQWPVQGMQSAMNVFSDLSPTTVAAPGKLAVSGTSETVGSLSGDGAIELLANGTFGIHTTDDAIFGGSFSGTGTVVKSGAAVQTLSGTLAVDGTLIVEGGVLNLDGAALDGITNIMIRAGAELTGSATVSGDLTVTFETGGRYSASLAVAGALTVEGTVTLTVPQGAEYPYHGTLFTFTSADAATRQALLNATKPSSVPAGYTALVRVTDTYAKLTIAPVGSVMTLR
jgi:autotransporter-associated beta strand protein